MWAVRCGRGNMSPSIDRRSHRLRTPSTRSRIFARRATNAEVTFYSRKLGKRRKKWEWHGYAIPRNVSNSSCICTSYNVFQQRRECDDFKYRTSPGVCAHMHSTKHSINTTDGHLGKNVKSRQPYITLHLFFLFFFLFFFQLFVRKFKRKRRWKTRERLLTSQFFYENDEVGEPFLGRFLTENEMFFSLFIDSSILRCLRTV